MITVARNMIHDAIIVGAGHNALVTAGYLARAGKTVLVLERRPLVGGACVTEEVFPGFHVSTAAYLCSLLQEKIVRDLELGKFGYTVIPKDPAYFSPFPDGRYIFFWKDLAQTAAEIARFSHQDAQAYPKYEAQLATLAEFVESLLLRTPPNLFPRGLDDFLKLAWLARRTAQLPGQDLAALLKIMTCSAASFLDEWFESDVVKVSLATDGVIGSNGGPQTPGTAYVLLHHCMGGVGGVRGLWGFVKGGMGAITRAMADSARSRGAEIRTDAPVARVRVREGRAVGVVLENGEEISGRVVVSGADPKRTFLHLLGRHDLDGDFRRGIERMKMEGTSFKMNLALDQLPDFNAFPGSAPGPQHRGTIHICPSLEYIERAWDDAKYGDPSAHPMLEVTIPTLYDPALAPPGKHVVSVFAQYAPYRLRQGSWREMRETFADRIIDLLTEYAPNIKTAIIGRHILSPLDLEEQFGMTGGNIFHGEMSLDQLFFMRPLMGWAKYRTPLRGLYLCGSGTHPGGGVMGAPGYNAAREILRDWKS